MIFVPDNMILNWEGFCKEDPKGMVDGTDLYTYTSNNPLVFTDPFGENSRPEQVASASTAIIPRAELDLYFGADHAHGSSRFGGDNFSWKEHLDNIRMNPLEHRRRLISGALWGTNTEDYPLGLNAADLVNACAEIPFCYDNINEAKNPISFIEASVNTEVSNLGLNKFSKTYPKAAGMWNKHTAASNEAISRHLSDPSNEVITFS